jgi:hypothetical protein
MRHPFKHTGPSAVSVLHGSQSPATWVSWLQIGILVVMLELALWSTGLLREVFSLAALVWVLATSIFPWQSATRLGLTSGGFRKSLWVISASAAVASLFVGTAWVVGGLHPAFGAKTNSYTYLAYALWAVIQQFILQSYLFVRFESLFADSKKAVLACAILFAFVHIPNPVLTFATFAAGLAFCEIFRRYRNLYSVGIAHALLGIALAVSVPSTLHHDMRVGIGFLHPPAIPLASP